LPSNPFRSVNRMSEPSNNRATTRREVGTLDNSPVRRRCCHAGPRQHGRPRRCREPYCGFRRSGPGAGIGRRQ
jgi:hypothetical protein